VTELTAAIDIKQPEVGFVSLIVRL